MIDVDKWQEIYTTVRQHKLRTALTAFGVFWGIFMLVVLLGAGRGLERGAMSNFGDVTNVVYLWVSNDTQVPHKGLPKGRWIHYTDADVAAIRDRVDEVEFVRGLNRAGGWGVVQYIVRGENSGSFFVRGSHPTMAPMHSIEVTQGRFVNEPDMQERRKVAIIGSGVRDVLFAADENPIGQDLNIHGVYFQIVGVFEPRSTGENARRDSEEIYIPNSTLRYAFNQRDRFGNIVIRPRPDADAVKVENEVKTLLMERHKIHPLDRGVIGSFNVQAEYDKVQGLFTGIAVFSWLVAAGTIMAGAIGVGNIMLIVVKERTREIGLRKALGATPASIVTMIVQESVVITAVAGYFGLVVGVVLLESIGVLMGQAGGGGSMFARPEIDFNTAATAIVILVASGVLAALLPAAKAAGVDPIVALQEE